MAGEIRINTTRLREDAAEILGCVEEIEMKTANLRALSAELDEMIGGPESEALKSSIEENISSLERLAGSLRAMSEFEMNARKKFDACESKVGDIVDQIRIR